MRFLQTLSAMFSLVILISQFNVGYGQRTYYVDSRMGNNSFDGSTFTVVHALKGPFYTIKRALSQASSGDTIAVRAGNYNREGLLETVDKDLTLVVYPNGSDQTVILEGIFAKHPDRTLTLSKSDQAPKGLFVTNGDEDDLTLQAGTIHITGGLAIGKGGVVTQADGSLTGNALIKLDH